jgi:hypothetical protein
MTNDRTIHKSPFADWYADQDSSRGVWLHDRTSDRKIKVERPAEWGQHWSWNVTEDGTGICFRRTGKTFAPETKVFSRLDGELGTILNQVGPEEYEVMTDEGIEVWHEDEIQAVED